MFVLQTISTVLLAISCSVAFINSTPMGTKWFFAVLALIVYLFTFAIRMLSLHSVTKWACRITVFLISAIAICLAMMNGLIAVAATSFITLVVFIVFEAVRRWA